MAILGAIFELALEYIPGLILWISFEEPTEKVAQIEKARRMILEIPTKDWSISNDDRAQFLFITRKYKISSNWATEQAAIKSEAYIEEVISCQYPNYFDIMTYSEPKYEQWEQAKLLAEALAEIVEKRKLESKKVSDHQ